MTSPLYLALSSHIEKNRERFHMPGHKGKLPFPLKEAALFDFTEVPDTGCLYDGEGAPVETEKAFSELYCSGATLLSAGGSTLCIQTMLSLFCPEKSRVLMSRNAHHSAVNTAALLDLEPVWLTADEAAGVLTYGRITPERVREALEQNSDVSAVYITSPDYFGTLCDIKSISEVCREFNKPLLIDNAHGAHLKFFDGLHPMECGADACCDSLHKTLPALTGGALLHLKNGSLKNEARRRMKLFGSTSPSYLIMLSCDMLVPQWEKLKAEYRALAVDIAELREKAVEKGILACDDKLRDPVRLSLLFPRGERDKTEKLLYSVGIEAEYISSRHIVLLISPENDLSFAKRLIEALPPLDEAISLPRFCLPQKFCSVRKAALADAESVSVSQSVGRICASPAAPCPPGAAVVMPGEIIDKNCAELLLQSGMTDIFVMK